MLSHAQFYLTKLAEECNEVAQRALKQVQFGKNQTQAKDYLFFAEDRSKEITPTMLLTNAQRLRQELNDLLASVETLELLGEIPVVNPDDLIKAVAEKQAKVEKYKKLSQLHGLVEP